jgi:hypothetical protein
MADAADLKSVVRKDVRVRLPPSAPLLSQRFHVFHQLSPGNDLSPKSEDGAKMVTLFLTGLLFELDYRASRFGKSVDCIFQRLGCASCVCTRDALDRVAE